MLLCLLGHLAMPLLLRDAFQLDKLYYHLNLMIPN